MDQTGCGIGRGQGVGEGGERVWDREEVVCGIEKRQGVG